MKGKSKKAKGKTLFLSASLRLCGSILLFGCIASAQWVKQTVDTTASFRGLSVVSEKVVWASGTGGTVIKTTDGGKTWSVMTVPGAEKLDFRDIEAFDAKTAYILSIGNGESSRIYKTIDGGKTWNLQFKNTNEKAFFDAMACWDSVSCIAMSDPVDNKFVLIETKNGGANWTPIDTRKMPATYNGEAAFAASGTCLITQGRSNAFIVSGGTDARVFKSTDRGKSWAVYNTPIAKGTPSSGIFSIAMRDAQNGVIVGGNYQAAKDESNTWASTTDGGKTWKQGDRQFGYRSGVIFLTNYILAVGTTGSDSTDLNGTWREEGFEDLNTVAAKDRRSIWAVGAGGMVANLTSDSRTSPQGASDPLSIADVKLSHSEIRDNCSPSTPSCSNSPLVFVSTLIPKLAGPTSFVYVVTGGSVNGEGANIQWDLSGVRPGTYSIIVSIKTAAPGGSPTERPEKTVTKQVVVH